MPTQVERDAMRAEQKAQMLSVYADVGTVREAAELVGISRRTHNRWLDADPDYARAFVDAREDAADTLEREAIHRAIVGTDEPVFYKGEICGYIRKKDTTLLIFLLNGLRPEKYRDRRVEVVTVDALDSEIARLEAELGRAGDPAGAESHPTAGVGDEGEAPR